MPTKWRDSLMYHKLIAPFLVGDNHRVSHPELRVTS